MRIKFKEHTDYVIDNIIVKSFAIYLNEKQVASMTSTGYNYTMALFESCFPPLTIPTGGFYNVRTLNIDCFYLFPVLQYCKDYILKNQILVIK
jgi:hypothetical protein